MQHRHRREGCDQENREADCGFVGLIGVQSNQFPRALDLARRFRAASIGVAIGGFHVSGCLAMLPELPPDLREALALGVTLYAGEAEGRWMCSARCRGGTMERVPAT